ncbi:hypothetical protein BV20DRAFT_1052161 [Pilatotrama ljubarskyi]|nr:hypothetical protein BV20DRAFT_1052161 [Pilatotrama ljubarskyi]
MKLYSTALFTFATLVLLPVSGSPVQVIPYLAIRATSDGDIEMNRLDSQWLSQPGGRKRSDIQ